MKNIMGFLCGAILICFNSLSAAATPKFTLEPLTPTTVELLSNDTANVQYRVTNNTNITRTLTMVPIDGITQTTAGAGVCASPFVLAKNQSCLLTLVLHGDQLAPSVIGGPKVCKTISNTNPSPDPFLCSQPALINILRITRTESELPHLTVENSPLTLDINGGIGTLDITNDSLDTNALNIVSDFTGTALAGNVSESANTCGNVAPGDTCIITYLAGNTAVALTSFPIMGSNTQTATGEISIVSTPISITGSPLTIGQNGGVGVITVTNDSLITTAFNIASDFTGTALQGNVTETGNTCAVVLPGNSCTLTFTGSNVGTVAQTSFPIQGINTPTATGQMTIVNLNIGDLYQGGYLFYIDPVTLGTGKVVNVNDDTMSPHPLPFAQGTDQTVAVGTTSILLDTGPNNTNSIVTMYGTGQGTNYAAYYCDSYEADSAGNSPCVLPNTCYTDWYLPSLDEGRFQIMVNTTIAAPPGPISGFVNGGWYATSSEASSPNDSTNYLPIQAPNGAGNLPKWWLANVRCSRLTT